MVQIWAKSEMGRFKLAQIGQTPQGIKVAPNVTDYEYVIGFWKLQPEPPFLGHFVCLFSDLDGLQN